MIIVILSIENRKKIENINKKLEKINNTINNNKINRIVLNNKISILTCNTSWY